MQTIFRTKLTTAYTVLPNKLLRDSRISFKAKGVLSMILSHSGDWVVNQGWIEKYGTEGREAIRSAMQELKEVGYARYEPQKGEDGTFQGAVWTFCDDPSSHLLNDGNPSDGMPPTSEVTVPEVTSKRSNNAQDSQDFLDFWAAYPHHRRKAKGNARRAFSKCRGKFSVIMAALENHKRSADWLKDGGKWIPLPASWLNGERWEDEMDESTSTPQSLTPNELTHRAQQLFK